MRNLLLAIALVIGATTAAFTAKPTVAIAASTLHYYTTESGAQRHCPRDTVVWLNTASGIYHLKGERWYGRTKHGAYVCKREADAAGDRETENGQ